MSGSERQASITRTDFGKAKDGTPVDLFTLTNAHGIVVRITNYGGIVTEIHTPDRNGRMGDIVLGFDNLDRYLAGHPFFGATAGRYANRIADARFTLDGKTYILAANNGPNSLHGGLVGFDKKVWKAESSMTPLGPTLRLSYVSPDGEEGYPGAVLASVVYTLTDANELDISYTATTDQATPINLTNHSYFNLGGTPDVLGTDLLLNASHYTPVDDTLIPTGEIARVAGTPLDFTSPHTIGDRIAALKPDPGGYDHNFVLDAPGDAQALAARAHDPVSGRVLEVRTTQPGVQFYSGNFLDGTITGKYGRVYPQHGGFCLETQHFPDSPNHPSFPSTILRPGETYRETTVWRFGLGEG